MITLYFVAAGAANSQERDPHRLFDLAHALEEDHIVAMNIIARPPNEASQTNIAPDQFNKPGFRAVRCTVPLTKSNARALATIIQNSKIIIINRSLDYIWQVGFVDRDGKILFLLYYAGKSQDGVAGFFIEGQPFLTGASLGAWFETAVDFKKCPKPTPN